MAHLEIPRDIQEMREAFFLQILLTMTFGRTPMCRGNEIAEVVTHPHVFVDGQPYQTKRITCDACGFIEEKPLTS